MEPKIEEAILGEDGYLAERSLRYEVLRAPLGMPFGSEMSPIEKDCRHFLAVLGGEVVGCLLLYPMGTKGRLLQMAVRYGFRNAGIGSAIVCHVEAVARALGLAELFLHARAGAVGFYEKLGYRVEGEPFVEVGINHRHMVKSIQPSRRIDAP